MDKISIKDTPEMRLKKLSEKVADAQVYVARSLPRAPLPFFLVLCDVLAFGGGGGVLKLRRK